MSEHHQTEHSSPIKTPKQLAIVVTLAFIVPVVVIIVLAQLAAGRGVSVPVVPIGIAYTHGRPRRGDSAALCFGAPLLAEGSGREAAKAFTADLATAMQSAEQAACEALGRPLAPA